MDNQADFNNYFQQPAGQPVQQFAQQPAPAQPVQQFPQSALQQMAAQPAQQFQPQAGGGSLRSAGFAQDDGGGVPQQPVAGPAQPQQPAPQQIAQPLVQPPQQSSGQTFGRVGAKSMGYAPAQVDAFFDKVKANWDNAGAPITERLIRFEHFSAEDGGYSPVEVDRALQRLEQALAKRDKAAAINSYGNEGWMQAQNNRISELWPTLSSPNKQKFEPAEKGEKAYYIPDVDKLIDTLKAQLFEGKQSLTSDDLRHITFETVKGKKGYSTKEVDYFIDETISIFNQLEIA